MTILVIIIIAVLIDIILGELPSKIHPVVLMGAVINKLKKLLSKYNNKVSWYNSYYNCFNHFHISLYSNNRIIQI